LLDASGKQGVPQGGVISPLLSNLYLNEVDQMLERAKEVTRYERWTAVEYARFADDLVILVDSHSRQQWLRQAGETATGGVGQTASGGERGKEP
jgi:RNA-directed DNA polymerase